MCGASLAARSTVLFKEIAGQSYRSQRIRRKMDHQLRQAISYIVFTDHDFNGCGKWPQDFHSEPACVRQAKRGISLRSKRGNREIPRRKARLGMTPFDFFRDHFSRNVQIFELQGLQPSQLYRALPGRLNFKWLRVTSLQSSLFLC